MSPMMNQATPALVSAEEFQMYNPKWIRVAIDATRTLFRWIPPTMEQLMKSTMKSLNSSIESKLSPVDITDQISQGPGLSTNGLISPSYTSPCTVLQKDTQETTSKKGGITQTNALNKLQLSSIQQTEVQAIELEVMLNYFSSYDENANYRGHNHETIYKCMGYYVDHLIKERILVPENKLGRIKVGSYTRTGLKIRIDELLDKKDAITSELNYHYGVNGEEVFALLMQGAASAAHLGIVQLNSETLNKFCEFISYSHNDVRCLIMGSPKIRNHMLKAMAA